MKKEEQEKVLASLKKISYNKKNIKVLIKNVIPFVEKDEETTEEREQFALKGELKLNGARISVIIRPEDIVGPRDYEALKALEEQYVLAKISFIDDYNKITATLKLKEDTNSPRILPRLNKEKEKEMLKNMSKYINKEIDVSIVYFNEYGALVADENDVGYFLYDSRFAYGYIPIKKVKKVGDVLRVKIIDNSKNPEGLYVEMVEKYQEEITTKPEEFEAESIVKGTIVKKTATLCFVNIAPMVDALCSPMDGYEEGTEVFIQIIGTKDLGNRKAVRGKIILTKFDDELKL